MKKYLVQDLPLENRRVLFSLLLSFEQAKESKHERYLNLQKTAFMKTCSTKNIL